MAKIKIEANIKSRASVCVNALQRNAQKNNLSARSQAVHRRLGATASWAAKYKQTRIEPLDRSSSLADVFVPDIRMGLDERCE